MYFTLQFLKMQKFTKPPLSLDEKVELLKNRGLTINDKEKAKQYLQHI
jgi:abortive infection bacteriophage resistance protein